MRCMSGRVARRAPQADATGEKVAPAPVSADPPELVEAPPPPDPVPMPPPYHHDTKSERVAHVLGPRRPKVHKDELPCQQDKVEADLDQVRDVYLKFQYADGPPADRPAGTAADEARARDLAIAAVISARAQLANGPFNNRGALPASISSRCAHARTEDARGDFIFQDGLGELTEGRPGDPLRLFRVGEDTMDNLPGPSLVRSLALMAASTIKLQGGVCEKFSSLVLGMLSTAAPAGTVACKVAWSGDHHFVVLRIGTSQWWVADPWPHNAFVLPWRLNCFKRSDIVAHTQMEVVSPVEKAYGVVFDEDQIEHSYQAAVRTLRYTRNDAEFAKNWTQRHNLKTRVIQADDPNDPPDDYDFSQHDDGHTVILAAADTLWG